MLSYSLLVLAAFAAGVVNAIAGGGAFITFPALVFAGVPPVAANASSTVALFPGQATSALAYRRDILGISEFGLPSFIGLSLDPPLVGVSIQDTSTTWPRHWRAGQPPRPATGHRGSWPG